MTLFSSPALSRGRFAGADALTLGVFAATLVLSALLLFSVQPLFAKLVLPLLGGSPGVWSVAMVFFQAMLLAGYAYAHGMTRLLDARVCVVVHLGVLALASLALPLALPANVGTPPADMPALWLLGLFASAIGLPFFAVAATAPMLQAWFARTTHRQANDPYFLYGASNLGSFVALLSYPVVIEPLLALRAQSWLWTLGFALLVAMIALAGLTMAANFRAPSALAPAAERTAVSWRTRLGWVALAFVPSALLIAVTSHISTDIASAPFLWVVPLALFLATFIVTFRPGGDGLMRAALRVQPILVAFALIGILISSRGIWLPMLVLDLAMLAVVAVICHRSLYLGRPDVSRLTGFYLWISVGGVLGGIFAGLLAPAIFPDIWEYALLIVLALLCRPGALDAPSRAWLVAAAALVTVASAASLLRATVIAIPAWQWLWFGCVLALFCAVLLSRWHPLRLTAIVAAGIVALLATKPGLGTTETARSFFGVHKVTDSADGRFRMLFHGTTLHGVQRLREDDGAITTGKPEPLTYYHRRGPMAEAIVAQRQRTGTLGSVAVVGLGTGSLACHAKTGERWRFYEIDPAVVRIASDPAQFRFLSECGSGEPVVVGDARLTLAAGSTAFDLIVLDAFSSDSVPVHLLTREAVGLYLSRLKPGGLLVFHISNDYLELASVVTEGAAVHGLATLVKREDVSPDTTKATMVAGSIVAAIGREADLALLASMPGWERRAADGGTRVWSDDYSNILAAIWRQRTR